MTYTDLLERVVSTYGKKRLFLIFLAALALTNEMAITGVSVLEVLGLILYVGSLLEAATFALFRRSGGNE